MAVQASLGIIVCETLSHKNPLQKRAGGMAQGVGPEFKPYSLKEKKRALLWISGNLDSNSAFSHLATHSR
jgi:hypothetical protein